MIDRKCMRITFFHLNKDNHFLQPIQEEVDAFFLKNHHRYEIISEFQNLLCNLTEDTYQEIFNLSITIKTFFSKITQVQFYSIM